MHYAWWQIILGILLGIAFIMVLCGLGMALHSSYLDWKKARLEYRAARDQPQVVKWSNVSIGAVMPNEVRSVIGLPSVDAVNNSHIVDSSALWMHCDMNGFHRPHNWKRSVYGATLYCRGIRVPKKYSSQVHIYQKMDPPNNIVRKHD